MDAVPVKSLPIKPPRRKKARCFTQQQRAKIEQFYRYAVKVAYDNAMIPYDDHEVRTVAHDALMSAVRYFRKDKDKGFKNFQSFCYHCILQKLSRAYHRRTAHQMVWLADETDIPYEPGPAQFEVREFTDYLQEILPAAHRELLYQLYVVGSNQSVISQTIGCARQNIRATVDQIEHKLRRRAVWSYIVPYTGPRATPLVPAADRPSPVPFVPAQTPIPVRRVGRGRPEHEALHAEIIRLWTTGGMAQEQIALKTGICYGTVNRILRSRYRARRAARDQLIIELSATMTNRAIAAQVDITEDTVGYILHRAGIYGRRKKRCN